MAGRWRLAYRQFSLDRLGFQDGEVAAKLSWGGLLDTSVGYSHGPYRVVELTSRQALELEGREQRHCVASYAVKCLLGESAIFSIRDRHTGQALSTLEIGLANNAPRLLRHHADENRPPAPELQSVAERFVELVLAPIPSARIAAVRHVRRMAGAKVCQLLGRPNTHEAPLAETERAALARMLSFAHPAEARRDGIPAYFARMAQVPRPLTGPSRVGGPTAPTLRQAA